MSDWGLAEQLGISVQDARKFIEKYYETYPEIKTYLNSLISNCEKNGYVKTIMNRIRYVPEIHDNNYNMREFGKRVAMNSPIQGTAADIIKKAMTDVDKLLVENDFKTKMILQIHDELVFDVIEEEKDILVPVLTMMMEEASNLRVKLKAESGIGKDWYSAK
jgi:DNA polymerase-1